MNRQQARIEALLGEAANFGATYSEEVPVDLQTSLAAEGYELSALDEDLHRIHSLRAAEALGYFD